MAGAVGRVRIPHALVGLGAGNHLDGSHGVTHPVVKFRVHSKVLLGISGVRAGVERLLLRLNVEHQHSLGQRVRNCALGPGEQRQKRRKKQDQRFFHIISIFYESINNSMAGP